MHAWNFFTFLLLLLAPVLLYVSAAFLVPDIDTDISIDLREYFYENHAAYFSINAAFTALLGAQNWILTGHPSPPRVTVIFAVWFVLLCLPAIIKNPRYHAAVAVLFVLLFLIFIVLFGLRLSGT